jgi:hypothetical protein
VAEFLEGQSDVDDGSYGEPVPNRAMSLLMAVEQEIERLKCSPEDAIALLREIDDSGVLYRNNLDLDAKVANFLGSRSATTCSPTVNKDDRG